MRLSASFAIAAAAAMLWTPFATVDARAQSAPNDSVGAGAAAETPAAPERPSAMPNDYRINAGDELEIYVWGEERLQRTTRVLPDGSFSFPLVGRVMAEGKLLSDVEAEISRGLTPQFRNQVPQVTVSVVAPSGMTISVIGKVRSPGTFTPGKYINVLQALTLAGGPAEFANVGGILILRRQGNQTIPIKAKLNRALSGSPNAGDLSAEGLPMLQSGDTVVVP